MLFSVPSFLCILSLTLDYHNVILHRIDTIGGDDSLGILMVEMGEIVQR